MGHKLLNSLVSYECADGAMRDGSRRDTTENSRGRVAQDATSVPRHWGGTAARADGLSRLVHSTAPTKPRGARFCCMHHASLSAGMTSRVNRSTVRSTSESVRAPKANCPTK